MKKPTLSTLETVASGATFVRMQVITYRQTSSLLIIIFGMLSVNVRVYGFGNTSVS